MINHAKSSRISERLGFFLFKALEKGDKTIETRAVKGRFQRVEAGDVLVFNCAKERIYGFPHYRDKIKNYGIAAYKLK